MGIFLFKETPLNGRSKCVLGCNESKLNLYEPFSKIEKQVTQVDGANDDCPLKYRQPIENSIFRIKNTSL